MNLTGESGQPAALLHSSGPPPPPAAFSAVPVDGTLVRYIPGYSRSPMRFMHAVSPTDTPAQTRSHAAFGVCATVARRPLDKGCAGSANVGKRGRAHDAGIDSSPATSSAVRRWRSQDFGTALSPPPSNSIGIIPHDQAPRSVSVSGSILLDQSMVKQSQGPLPLAGGQQIIGLSLKVKVSQSPPRSLNALNSAAAANSLP